MRSYLNDIEDFHQKFELPAPNTLPEFMQEMYEFRQRFLLEEFVELQSAWHRGDLVSYLDGLVDLDYVGIGTFYLLRGQDDRVLHKTDTRNTNPPHLPSGRMFALFVSQVAYCLGRFFTELERHSDNLAVYEVMRTMHVTIVAHCIEQGLDFREAWDRVQAANMLKVRALRREDSLRGSVYDVVKPPGWVAPDLTDLCR